MAEDHPQRERSLQVAAAAANEAEADLMCQRLAEAGISAISQRSIGGPQWGASGGQYVYVEAEHLARAREILRAPDGVSEEELARLSDEAAPAQLTQPAKGEPIEIRVPKRSTWKRLLRRAAKTDGRDTSAPEA
jgi:hypothetical protein